MNDLYVLVLDLKWICQTIKHETIGSYDLIEECRKRFETTPLYKDHDYRVYNVSDELEPRNSTDIFITVKDGKVCYYPKVLSYNEALKVSKLINCNIRRLEPVGSLF